MATYTIVTPVLNNQSLFDVFTKPPASSGTALSTFTITNLLNGVPDGTVTTFTGNNLTWNGATATAGTVTSIVRRSADGTITYDQITDFTGVNNSFPSIWNPTGQGVRAGFIFSGADTHTGGAGNDFFRGYNGIDTFNGGDGNDQVGYDNDTFAGGNGAITVNLSAITQAGVASNRARDGFGNIDVLNSIEEARGGAGADQFFGSTTHNFFSGRGGADTYDGGNTVAFFNPNGGNLPGTSWNWVDYRQDGGTQGISLTLTNGTANPGTDGVGNTAGSGTDTFNAAEAFTNINAIRGSNNASVTDTVTGNAFTNFFEGLQGVDVFDGNEGVDRYSYSNEFRFGGSTTRGVVVNLSNSAVVVGGVNVAAHTGIDTYGASGFVDSLIDVEEISATNQADTIHGSEFDNNVYLLSGNDEAFLGRGFDYVEPGAGNDIIHGEAGAGFDQSYEDRDEVSYDDFGGNGIGVYIDLNINTFVDPTGGTDTVTDIERLRGTSSADTLLGADAANQREEMYRGLAGNDTIDGRNGYDIVDYSRDALFGGSSGIIANLSTAAITVNGVTVQGGTVRDAFGATDAIFYIEGVRGTPSNDTMVGNAGNNTFRSQGGSDTIDGGAGLDTVEMYAGDVFSGPGAIVNLHSNPFVSSVTVNPNIARGVDGGESTLTSIENVTGSSSDDAINGSDARNFLNGWFGDDVIFGNGGDDVIMGLQGDNDMHGGDGFDTVSFMYDPTIDDYFALNFPGNGFGLWGGVTVNLGTFSAVGFDARNNTLTNFEAVTGTFFDDNITGDGFDNSFRGASGNDTMNGAGGNDTVNYSPTNQDGRILVPLIGINYSEPNVVRVNLSGASMVLGGTSVAAGTALDGEGFTDTLVSIENVTGSIGADFIAANGVSNVIDGWTGDDTVFYPGMESEYTITAVNGGWQVVRTVIPADSDFLRNVETLVFTGSGSTTLAPQGLTAAGDATDNELVGVEGDDDLDGGAGADFVDGGEGDDDIAGGSGADDLTGGDGDDTVDGGDNDDTIIAGSGQGNDTYIGGSGIDTAIYTSTTLGIVVDLDVPGNPGGGAGTATGSEIDTDQLTGIENVVGGQGADSITGNGQANNLQGVAGADQLFGEGGNDSLQGGSGNDILHGGADNDSLFGDSDDDTLKGGDGNDLLDGGANSLVGGDTADFSDATGPVFATLGLDGDAVVTAAGIGTDTLIRIENLTGGSSDDTLTGNAFNNVFSGGAGEDTVAGDAGDDRFVFSPGGGADTYTDFAAGAGSEDKIDLTAFTTIHTLGSVLARATQIGGDTLIDFGNGDTVTLKNVVKGSLTDDDFVLAPLAAATPNDFNGDALSDILWRHANGELNLFVMDGRNVVSTGTVRQAGTAYQVEDENDFDGDGNADILWRNTIDGTPNIFLMDGRTVVNDGNIRQLNDSWEVQDTADFSGDGKADILWRNTIDGTANIWLMDGRNIIEDGNVRQVHENWQVQGTGDFDGDGNADILWRSTDGTVNIYQMDGRTVLFDGNLSRSPNNHWQVQDVADFNGDGNSDILWRNTIDGTANIWLMDGRNVLLDGNLSTSPNTDWQVEDTGDYNGDGNADILWRNTIDGTANAYLMDGMTVVFSGNISTQFDNDWQIV